ncbi:GntR family transcriptional regulator [Bacillus alkalicellulosilyticus]|uniref:GntR family transcriptional regulator n=1 Tax=Alkalihalobacterium alkalicellulosilyticum TaxID=1912214 RepID=UPI00099854C0|nr:GntR family transcriptional regulator [Bacillus alkalicellulosilyticus]
MGNMEKDRPLYLEVIDKLKEDIKNETYKEGVKLPSEYELSRLYEVSRATLREALRILEEEGFIVRRHGVGTFVHSTPLFNSGIEELTSVTDMIEKGNKVPGTIFLSSNHIESTIDDKETFKNDSIEELVVMERVRTADDEPVAYCIDKAPAAYIPNHSIHETKSIYQILEEKGRVISYAISQIEPVGFHEDISPMLQCDPETALLLLKQMHYDEHDNPILYSLNYFRADKFKFHVVRKRLK